ncbi:mitochondrial ribosome small subunit component [Scheffersomyces coipomensis]|uniref:mitochondrial ribosome small subunit component n=1 Tax=Scheffersomyces coipomensis TaxID=1788519 RepID=UPI00315D06CD
MSSLLKKIPSQARLNQAKELSAAVFGHTWNPACKRNGSKILRQELKGPQISKYYGVNEELPTFKDFKKWFPELKLVDPREEYRLKMVQDRKKRNKGAPKKKSE